MAEGLFLAFIDGRDDSRAAWIDQAERLGDLDGVRSVLTYRLSASQVPLPGSLAVDHTGLVACRIDDVAASADAIGEACWSLLQVPTSAGYFYEVERARRVAEGAPDGGPSDCYLAFTNPGSPERLEEFHEWYDTDHVPALLSVPGVHAATRYRRLVDAPALGSAQFGDFAYLTFYEVDAAMASKALGEALAGAADGGLADSSGDAGMPVTDAVDFDRYIQVFYQSA